MEKPFVFAKGDETTALIGELVVETFFDDIPRIDIPLSVEQRIETEDGCIRDFANAFQEHGAAVKMSTASKDPRILDASLGSANIALRNMLGVLGMWRMVYHPRNYNGPVAVFRYASGGFYDEVSYSTRIIEGIEYGFSTTRCNLSNIPLFVEVAVRLAKQHGLKIYVVSKQTIAQSEKVFNDRVVDALKTHGVIVGPEDQLLTDAATAERAVNHDGNALFIMDNVAGDTGSDVVDAVDGSRTMSSTLYCAGGLNYQELPGGTACDKFGTDLKGENFFDPTGIIMAIGSAVTTANPGLENRVRDLVTSGLLYVRETDAPDRSTYEMIESIAKAA